MRPVFASKIINSTECRVSTAPAVIIKYNGHSKFKFYGKLCKCVADIEIKYNYFNLD